MHSQQPRLAAAAVAVLLVAALAPQPSHAQLGGSSSAFLGQLGGATPGANATRTAAAPCNGTTPVKLVIESVTPIAGAGATPEVVIRNSGGQPANITGYRITYSPNGANASASGQNTLYIANERRCAENGSLPSGQSKVFKPRSDTNPCGFPFQMGSSGTVTLSDYNDRRVSAMSWNNATEGTQVHITPDGSAAELVPGGSNVIDVLKALGDYSTFVLALESTGLAQQLTAANAPNYTGPTIPEQEYVIDLPWWFAGTQGAAAAPPPPPPPAPQAPPPVGVPAAGPYTILAPTDDAFDTLLVNMGGAQGKVPLDALLRLPQLRDILLYHIVPGEYTSEYLRNNTPVYTAKGAEVVPFVDGCMTEGKLMLHDSCIDKPTGDNYTCAEQKAFDKCNFPFITSPLAAQWQGGFCQRTCQRCDCSAGSGIVCSTVLSPDLAASNGVIQGISRVLFPPPVFSKEQAIAEAIAYNASLARNQSLGIAAAPGMTGINDMTGVPGALPGAAAPITPGVPGALPSAANQTAGAPGAGAGAANQTAPVTSPALNASPVPGTANETSPGPSAGRRRLQRNAGASHRKH